jgi:hypothetical protein
MWEMMKGGARGLLTGKMFSNPGLAYGMGAVGVGVTAGLCVGGWKVGLPLPVAAGLAAFVGGVLQPRLFKNIKLV